MTFVMVIATRQSIRFQIIRSEVCVTHEATYRTVFSASRHMVPLMRAAVSFWASVPPNTSVETSTKPTFSQMLSRVKKPILSLMPRNSSPATSTVVQSQSGRTRPLPR